MLAQFLPTHCKVGQWGKQSGCGRRKSWLCVLAGRRGVRARRGTPRAWQPSPTVINTSPLHSARLYTSTMLYICQAPSLCTRRVAGYKCAEYRRTRGGCSSCSVRSASFGSDSAWCWSIPAGRERGGRSGLGLETLISLLDHPPPNLYEVGFWTSSGGVGDSDKVMNSSGHRKMLNCHKSLAIFNWAPEVRRESLMGVILATFKFSDFRAFLRALFFFKRKGNIYIVF